MIKSIVINNIALISRLELNFSEGLTVLSGETGSGKSIIVDSLGFVLGERADKTLIKYGEESADVTALFEVEADSPVIAAMEAYGYGNDTEILISRKMSVAGKNEIRIQGRPATLAILKEVSSQLADIFGQSQHLNLLKQDKQLETLDAFCHFGGCEEALEENYAKLREINKQLRGFGGDEAERARLADILRFQIEEIENANLSEREEAELEAEHKRIVNLEKISSALNSAAELLDGEFGAIGSLGDASASLSAIGSVEEHANDLAKRLKDIQIEADDIRQTIDGILAETEYSPSEIDRVETRREDIRMLKRKYGGSIAETLKFLAEAKEKYSSLVNATELLEKLNDEKHVVLETMYGAAKKKSAERKKTAKSLSDRISKELGDLGMSGTTFEVQFSDEPTFEEYCKNTSANGFDSVEFLMSANVGEPLKPLAKVISGGEMSRFMLAIKNITAQAENISTMVFDEIDAGISGNMAHRVAEKLANVSCAKKGGYQCIVITHLPQIAAMADVNMLISKHQQDGRTVTVVSELNGEEKAAEVSRLMGGVGEHALQSATELLEKSALYKKSI